MNELANKNTLTGDKCVEKRVTNTRQDNFPLTYCFIGVVVVVVLVGQSGGVQCFPDLVQVTSFSALVRRVNRP